MADPSQRPRVEIGIDCPDPHALAPFWQAALGYDLCEGDGEPYLSLLPSDGEGPVVFLQRTAEPTSANGGGLHFDLYADEPETLVHRLVELGATEQGEPTRGEGGRWAFQMLADPAGNVFCVCAEAEEPAGALEDYR